MDRPDPKDGIGWGLRIQIRHPFSEWLEALERVPAEHREDARQYLKGIAARVRAQREAKARRGA